MNFALYLCGFRSCCECGAETRPVPNLASTLPDWRRGLNSSGAMELPLYDVRGPVFSHHRWCSRRRHFAPVRLRARGHASTMGKAGNCRRFAAPMASRLYFWFAHYLFCLVRSAVFQCRSAHSSPIVVAARRRTDSGLA